MGWFSDALATQQTPQMGSLQALGGGMNTPQPVPGMPPQPLPPWAQGDPNMSFDPSKLTDQYKNDWSPRNPDGTLATGGVTPIPGYGNRGSGQPLNQPMGGFGSLQSLGMDPSAVLRGAQGAQQIGQMINLRGPDGSHKAVPMDQAAHWISKGAVRF